MKHHFSILPDLFCLKSKIANPIRISYNFLLCYTALSTLPERRHLVQTLTLWGVPFTTARTLFRFGAQVLLDCLCECEYCTPAITPLLQISHLLAIKIHLLLRDLHLLKSLLIINCFEQIPFYHT